MAAANKLGNDDPGAAAPEKPSARGEGGGEKKKIGAKKR